MSDHTSGPGRLPDVIVIGAMKTGTTTLHALLDEHPDVSMSVCKEPHFFVEAYNWHRGVDWYRCLFDSDARLCGEASVSYTAWPFHDGVAERMRSLVPSAKLIYCIRDPIARVVSQYKHRLAKGRERRPIDEAVLDGDYVARSRYDTQLRVYERAGWAPEQILIVETERLRDERSATMDRILDFLRLDRGDVDFDAVEDRNVSVSKTVPSAAGRFLHRTARPLLERMPKERRRVVRDTLLHAFPATMPDVALSQTTLGRLREALAEDARRLRERTGRSFVSWSV